jgi:hypothetical protein
MLSFLSVAGSDGKAMSIFLMLLWRIAAMCGAPARALRFAAGALHEARQL